MSSMEETSRMNDDSFDERESMRMASKFSSRPISGILQEIVSHISEIIRSEVRLARAEISQDAAQVANASVFLIVGAVLGLYAFGFLLLAAVYALGNTLPAWASALIVGGGIGIAGGIFFVIGRGRMKVASLKPDKTIQSLQENVTWVKKQTR